MAKWRAVVIIWIGILLYFGAGSFHPNETDLVLIILYSALVLAASIYTLVVWSRDLVRGASSKSAHLSAYPMALLRFVFDEREAEQRTEQKRLGE